MDLTDDKSTLDQITIFQKVNKLLHEPMNI